eukprot:gnl/MRDRNA2_/MRDRNA2_72747_c0_seq2.p1 gnl/MRDRNA2_/MRDRNA2_72747_c0~~gnl/MRDRNA2_/MRDRNA2_72747_c0_seq2.p1  ORF type:complete len:261 (-),score=49.81 gnl/MRDRNA2_/MRDRNA2_72747_c0_seq2:17-799(-)
MSLVTDPDLLHFLQLRAGDAVLHRWDLQHGVQVNRGKRLSWILWLQDSAPCVDQEELHRRPFLRKSAEEGNVIAMSILGSGASGRTLDGQQWLRRAADAGLPKAMAQLGASTEGPEARRWLLMAAERGDTNAQANVGLLSFREGNLEDAKAWLKRAASAGHATAQNELGMILLTGAAGSSEPNPYAGASWLSKAARQGHRMAQSNIGFCHAEGKGVEQSPAAALYWWSEAALQGNQDAQANLQRLQQSHPEWPSWPMYRG